MLDGTIAENIARFGEIDSAAVIQAAEDAGIHEMVLSLPEGYDTLILGQQGVLSPGQRQRIALARALYMRPKLIVLDEPNSNLDEQGELALNKAIFSMKNSGSTVILVSHRQGVLPLVDYLIFMRAGCISEQGSKADIVARENIKKHGTQPQKSLQASAASDLPKRELSDAR